ncbi:MAG: hypothetical protein NC489_23655 [Ruminococcus flavefaciens]|nr:hypothetical protein [Ruminococcus flavefaciens]
MEEPEMETTAPVPDDQLPSDPVPGGDAADGTEDSDSTGDTDETADAGTPEDTEETEPRDETGDTGTEDHEGEPAEGDETGGDTGTKDHDREPAEGDETGGDTGTISGNDIIAVNGNAVIFPEDFDLSLLSGGEGNAGDVTALAEAVAYQSELIYGISAAAVFLLGVIAGILLIHGFRLRRT